MVRGVDCSRTKVKCPLPAAPLKLPESTNTIGNIYITYLVTYRDKSDLRSGWGLQIPSMAEEAGAPTIGERAESILCVGVFGDADDDFEVVHKFTSRLPVPAVGGALEFSATKGRRTSGVFRSLCSGAFALLLVDVFADHCVDK